MTVLPLVSIAVTTRNSAATLSRCLDSICQQTYSNIELVVVDNFSDDDSFEIAREFSSCVMQSGPERAAQRNRALRDIATGRFAGYVDSDMILGPEVVSKAVDALSAGAVAVYVPEVILRCGWIGDARRFERAAYEATPVDAVRFFWRQAFLSVGGFEEKLFGPGPEDWDLDLKIRRLGEVTSVHPGSSGAFWPLEKEVLEKGVKEWGPGALYHDETSMKLRDYIAKKAYYGPALTAYHQKWKDNPRVHKQFSPKYRFVDVFLEDGKWKITFRRFDLYLGVLALRISAATFMLVSGAFKLQFTRVRTKN